jgi:hypothetical protein
MTGVPVPRYALGDVVFSSGMTSTTKSHSCPDCLGTRKWSCTSPAGETHEMDCPRCASYSSFHGQSSLPPLRYQGYATHVQRLTIGSVRIDTAEREDPVQYMAHETGVGSGSIYRERSLYPTKDEATEASDLLVAEAEARIAAWPEAMRAHHFSGLSVNLAADGLAREARLDAYRRHRWLRETVQDLAQEDGPVSTTQLQEALDEDDRVGKGHKSVVEDLIRAVRLGDLEEALRLAEHLPT